MGKKGIQLMDKLKMNKLKIDHHSYNEVIEKVNELVDAYNQESKENNLLDFLEELKKNIDSNISFIKTKNIMNVLETKKYLEEIKSVQTLISSFNLK